MQFLTLSQINRKYHICQRIPLTNKPKYAILDIITNFIYPTSRRQQMKQVELIFRRTFKQQTREHSNPGVKAANLFWPQALKHLEGKHVCPELAGNPVLKEYFSTGYAAAETLKVAFEKADQIKAIHHIDSSSFPSVTVLFFKNTHNQSYYELTTSFNATTGAPLMIGRSEKTQHMHQA